MNEPSEPARRLLVVTDCAHGGTFEVAKVLVEGLRDAFAVSLAAPVDGSTETLIRWLRGLGVEFHPIRSSYENLWRSTYDQADAMRVLDAVSADLVVCVDGAELSSLLALKAVARRRRIPYVVVVNLLSDDVLVRFAPFLKASRESLRHAQSVVFVSDASRRRFETLLPDVSCARHVVPNVCRDMFFEPRDESVRMRLRDELGVQDGEILCFTAARIEERKGQALGVAAFAKLKAAGGIERFRWMIAGRVEPWDRTRFDEAAAAAGVADRIMVLGERADIPDLMDASDVFVLTSYAEGMPLCVIEALAKGVPVIATGVDGIVEQVDATCGILLPAPSGNEATCIDALTEALTDLAGDPGRLARMRDAAHSRARALFHRDIGVGRYRDILTQDESGRADPDGAADDEPDFSLRPGTVLDFSDVAQVWNYLDDGWAQCEPEGIWTSGTSSVIRLQIAEDSPRLYLRFEVTPFAGRRGDRTTRVFANDRLVATWRPRRLRKGRQVMSAVLDPRDTGRSITLRFENPGATRPCDIGLGSDWRQLALFFHRLVVETATPATWHDTLRQWRRSRFGKVDPIGRARL